MRTRQRKNVAVTKTRKSIRQEESVMKSRKRKNAAVTKTRKSKRQEESTVVPVSSDESESGECTDVPMGQNIVEGMKMPKEQLRSYAQRAIICERLVAERELKDSHIPHVIKTSCLEGICKIKGRANLSLVREFFAGIDRSKVDKGKGSLVSVVRGTTIVVSPDALAKFGKFDRPLPDEPHFPYTKGDKKPAWREIWATLCKSGREPDERDMIYVRDLRRDFLFLQHMFWWNVYPKPPRCALSKEQAGLLYAVYNGRKPDIAQLWVAGIYAAFCNEKSVPSLPLGVMLTNFMMKEYKVAIDRNDDWDVQKKPLGRATIGRSEGQSRHHVPTKTPAIGTVEGNNDLLLALHENLSDALDLLVAIDERQERMEKRQIRMDNRMRTMEKQKRRAMGKGVESDSEDEDESDAEPSDEDETESDGNDRG